jgi:hypothetical protein
MMFDHDAFFRLGMWCADCLKLARKCMLAAWNVVVFQSNNPFWAVWAVLEIAQVAQKLTLFP